MHYVLVKDGRVAHIWHGPIPKGIANTYPVAPGSAHVGDRWEGGAAVKDAPIVTIDEINAECERRILALYPVARQLNIIDEGTPAEQQEFKDRRNGLRACARALIAMSPIPTNYRDDRFWVGAPFQGSPRPMEYHAGFGQMGYAGPQIGIGHPQVPYGYAPGAPSTNQPIIMMQAPSPQAPIIINGAQPGTTVIQGPAQVQPQVIQPPHVNIVQPAQVVAPATAQPEARGLPSPDPVTSSQPVIDEDEILYETAARALQGHEAAVQYMTEIASAVGRDMKEYCEELMRQRFERFDRVLRAKAASAV